MFAAPPPFFLHGRESNRAEVKAGMPPPTFMNMDNFKRVLDGADASLARDFKFRIYDAEPSVVLRSLGMEAMRAAASTARPGAREADLIDAAVRHVTDTLRAKHRLDKGGSGAMRDYERERGRENREARAPPPSLVETVASEKPPPPLTDAEVKARLLAREEGFKVAGIGRAAPDDGADVEALPFEHVHDGEPVDAGSPTAANATMLQRLPQPPKRPHHRPVPPVLPPEPPPAFVNRLHHLVVTSLDRDWMGAHPLRYEYQVLLEGGGSSASATLNARLRNIVSVEINYLIIPTEISLNKMDTTTDNIAWRARNLYENSYSFNFPYLLVHAAEMKDNFYGTNDAIRGAFGVLTHASSFDDVNGRTYEILKPVASHRIDFRPPLAALSALSLAFRMPNGALLNNATDGLVVLSFAYGGNVRPNLIKVVTRYFDRNEYYIGDYVQFAGFDASGLPSGAGIAATAFVTRSSGHQVFDMGDVNPDAYYNSFYIRAPGTFDPVVGAFKADQAVLVDISGCYGVGCMVLNMSLQNTLHLTVTTAEMAPVINYSLVGS